MRKGLTVRFMFGIVPTGRYMTQKTNTKEEILEAACRLMSLRGFHRTSLEDILRESRVGKGNFYYYFRSKEELGYAVLAGRPRSTGRGSSPRS